MEAFAPPQSQRKWEPLCMFAVLQYWQAGEQGRGAVSHKNDRRPNYETSPRPLSKAKNEVCFLHETAVAIPFFQVRTLDVTTVNTAPLGIAF